MNAREERIEMAMTDIQDETDRALRKHGPERTMDSDRYDNGGRLAILMEEVGEVAKALTYDQQGTRLEQVQDRRAEVRVELFGWENGVNATYFYRGSEKVYTQKLTDRELLNLGWERTTAVQRLRKELVQVGAMAATWISWLDQQPPKLPVGRPPFVSAEPGLLGELQNQERGAR